MDLQSVIVYIIIAVAIMLIARHLYRKLTGKGDTCKCGCDGCANANGCDGVCHPDQCGMCGRSKAK